MKVFLGLILSIFVLFSCLYAEEKESSNKEDKIADKVTDKVLNKSDKLIDRATDKFLNKFFN
ncbi:hypothetical protein ACXLC0_001587 [Campylobacter upsaliensis]|nr:hypothetical protein [Campylobacter upsaliensis]EDP6910575.1 hypothetical protein [Campylobacter upsaliensis]EIZ1024131.1 hypothetical protein [Campylobacter upsaliensis]EJF0803509.1 hypothetical protein [Campylobacter upsaliensis]ELZ7776587.1 hypothetical protein [Campylobacter upsaliensis]